MTAREFFGCSGLLAALALAVVNTSCTNPPTVGEVKAAAAKVASAVQDARDAADATCDKAVPACAVYFDAVRAGLVPDDDRAELACAKANGVCALVAPDAGAP